MTHQATGRNLNVVFRSSICNFSFKICEQHSGVIHCIPDLYAVYNTGKTSHWYP